MVSLHERRPVILVVGLGTVLVWVAGVFELVSQSRDWQWRGKEPLAPIETLRYLAVALMVSLAFFAVFSLLVWAYTKSLKTPFSRMTALFCGMAALVCGGILVLWLLPRFA